MQAADNAYHPCSCSSKPPQARASWCEVELFSTRSSEAELGCSKSEKSRAAAAGSNLSASRVALAIAAPRPGAEGAIISQPMPPKAKQSARRAAAKAKPKQRQGSGSEAGLAGSEHAEEGHNSCDLPACDNEAQQTPCCRRRLCQSCQLQLVRVCLCRTSPRYTLTCPLCRSDCGVPLALLKEAMAKHCPSHAKVAQSRCPVTAQVAVVHSPCEHSCYDCDESSIIVRTL